MPLRSFQQDRAERWQQRFRPVLVPRKLRFVPESLLTFDPVLKLTGTMVMGRKSPTAGNTFGPPHFSAFDWAKRSFGRIDIFSGISMMSTLNNFLPSLVKDPLRNRRILLGQPISGRVL
jgi:hypothetical protein